MVTMLQGWGGSIALPCSLRSHSTTNRFQSFAAHPQPSNLVSGHRPRSVPRLSPRLNPEIEMPFQVTLCIATWLIALATIACLAFMYDHAYHQSTNVTQFTHQSVSHAP